MPTASDLVTDLPADFEVFGQAVDTSLADLKGGTTGQVLSKASNTNMDFTWVTTDDANAIQNSIVDAKGDLVAASANDTPARLAVGNNGETLVADSSTSTGLRYQPNFSAGKNAVINGAFNVWQRGTSFTLNSAQAYTADRFRFDTGNNATASQQTFTPGTAPVSGYESQYYLRYVRTTTTNTDYVRTFLEDVRTFAGQTVTFSFWAKVASGTPTLTMMLGQNFGSGGSGSVEVTQNITLSTSWARYTYTTTLGSMSGKTIGTGSYVYPLLIIPAAAGTLTLDTWGWQVEASNTATAFQTATGTIQGELAACQRYYWRATTGTGSYAPFAYGPASSTTQGDVIMYFPVTMRTSPTSVDYSTVTLQDTSGSNTSPTAIALQQPNPGSTYFRVTVASGLTQFRTYVLGANNSLNAYIGVSAEL